MRNPLTALAEPAVKFDNAALLQQQDKETYSLCHEEVYNLRLEHRRDIPEVDLADGKLINLPRKNQFPTREERQEEFVHAISVKLGEPWDRLARKVSNCREDYINKKGEEDPGFYRRRSFRRQTEARLDEFPSDKFYFQVKCCARTALSKKSLNEFATIAQFYGFGVKEKPVEITEDIEALVKEKERKDNESPYYGTQVETSLGGDPNDYVLGFRYQDGQHYRFAQSESGQKTFVDNSGKWVCMDSKALTPPEEFAKQTHSWMLYKASPKAEVYLPLGISRQFAIDYNREREQIRQIFEDGTVKEMTIDGVTIIKPVKSGS